jgi:NADPH:quinone reductase-like Zn-dependent oxidoreductase
MVAAIPAQVARLKMRALVQEGSGSADVLHIREVERPELTDDGVLVRVRAASVNALDWHLVHGGRGFAIITKLMRQPPPPPIRGADVSGVVEAVGKDVALFRPGDEVFGIGGGTFAEYIVGVERALQHKPAELSFEEAGASGVAALTALQAVRDHGSVRPGDRVLVHGAGGGVGTFAVQFAEALGAHVTAVTSPRNVDVVRSLGPDRVMVLTDDEFRRDRYDVIVDVASTRSIRSMLRLLTPAGRYVVTGAPKGSTMGLLLRVVWARMLARFDRRVVNFVARTNRDDLATVAGMLAAGTVRVAIDRTYPLDDAAEAVRYVGTGQARAKVVITVP